MQLWLRRWSPAPYIVPYIDQTSKRTSLTLTRTHISPAILPGPIHQPGDRVDNRDPGMSLIAVNPDARRQPPGPHEKEEIAAP